MKSKQLELFGSQSDLIKKVNKQTKSLNKKNKKTLKKLGRFV